MSIFVILLELVELMMELVELVTIGLRPGLDFALALGQDLT